MASTFLDRGIHVFVEKPIATDSPAARDLVARIGLQIDVTRLLSDYPVAVQQLVAIARALSIESRVLILDEPTSSLDDDEVQKLFEVLRRLRSEGLSIVFVTHFLNQVYAVSDRITVLRNGSWVGEWKAQDLGPQALIAAMLGREMAAASTEPVVSPQFDATQPTLLQTEGLAQDTQLQLFLFGSIVLFELHLSQELLSIIVIFRVELFSFVVVTTQFNQRVVSRGDRFLSSKAPVCMRF